jgi:predicted metal-dependent phosphoesterase TrpH
MSGQLSSPARSHQVRPKVIVAGAPAQVALRAIAGPGAFEPGRSYDVRVFSKVNRTEDARLTVVADERGELIAPARFTCAGEAEIQVRAAGGEDIIASDVFFAVAPAMARWRPFKGDLHMHTTGSDGKALPLAMARRARQVGHDFIAITDHDNYEPSRQAMAAVAQAGIDLLVLGGEEVTIRENGGHILSLNATGGVSALQREPGAEAQRAAIIDHEIGPRQLVHPLTPAQYASAVWVIRKIRELGGLAIIAHPYWMGTAAKYYPPRCTVEQLLDDRLCDGIEVLGGSPNSEGNRLAIASYAREAARGHLLSVVAGSDAHCEADVGARYWTIALCERLDVSSIVQAIAQRRTVACDAPAGAEAALYGPFEILEYVYFLHREYFPLHDRACAAGGTRAQVDQASDDFWADANINRR